MTPLLIALQFSKIKVKSVDYTNTTIVEHTL